MAQANKVLQRLALNQKVIDVSELRGGSSEVSLTFDEAEEVGFSEAELIIIADLISVRISEVGLDVCAVLICLQNERLPGQ